MPAPLNPLTKAHLDALAGLSEPANGPGADEIERRAQELWNEWLKIYFSGNPFFTPGRDGQPVEKQFPACELCFGQATPEQPASRPIIHLLLTDRREQRNDRIPGGLWSVEERWTYNLMVRTSSQSPADPAKTGVLKDAATRESDRINREVASHLHWLLMSAEAGALALKGLGNLDLAGGPREIPAGGWHIRQLAFTARVFLRVVDPQA